MQALLDRSPQKRLKIRVFELKTPIRTRRISEYVSQETVLCCARNTLTLHRDIVSENTINEPDQIRKGFRNETKKKLNRPNAIRISTHLTTANSKYTTSFTINYAWCVAGCI